MNEAYEIELAAKVREVKGVHAVWLRFNTDDEESFQLDWFKFK
jgi:hypothetical protein